MTAQEKKELRRGRLSLSGEGHDDHHSLYDDHDVFGDDNNHAFDNLDLETVDCEQRSKDYFVYLSKFRLEEGLQWIDVECLAENR